MNTTFEICIVDKYKMRITDTTNPDNYLPENELEQLNPTQFRYKDTCTLDIITYKDNILHSYLNNHESFLNEVYYDIPKDGNYTIHHIIIPNNRWLDYINTDFLKNYETVYYTNNDKIYNLTRNYVEELEGFGYKLKTLETLNTNTNWYYIKQNSEIPCFWKVDLSNTDKITSVNANIKAPEDYYKQWCFVKNGDRIDIYNRATKKKLVDNFTLSKNTNFTGWEFKKVYNSSFESDSVFYLKRTINGESSIINIIDSQFTTSKSSNPASHIICEEVYGVDYKTEFTDDIKEITNLYELINSENSSILKTQQDTFAICHVHNCYLNICQNIYNNMLYNKCNNYKDNNFIFNRDFLYMIINVIKYNLDLGYTEEAQRILDEFNSCGNNICNNSSMIDYGCGCS